MQASTCCVPRNQVHISYRSSAIANFLVKFSNFRYHGNRRQISLIQINSPTPKTPCLVQQSGRIFYTSRVIGNFLSIPRGWTPLKFGWNRSGVALLRKPAISLKRDKIGSRLLLMTNRKLHTPFQLLPKSTTLDDLEGELRALFQNTCVFRSSPRKFEWR